MTILWCSEILGDYNFPYPSSSGTIAYNIVTRLLDRKINVAVADPWASRHRSYITHTEKAIGQIYATYGGRDIADVVERVKPETIVTDDLKLVDTLLTIPNVPEIILITRSSEIPRMYAGAVTIVAVSASMTGELENTGFRSVYVPLGVDTDIFGKIEKAKKGFVFGCVCANRPEKNLPVIMEAYRRFNDTFKNAAALAIHTNNGAWDLRKMVRNLGIQDMVFFGNWPADLNNMARIYNTFDVHINIGGREWSALPVLESMACGVPQIVADYGVLHEYAEGCGELVVPQETVTLPPCDDIFTVNADDLEQAMERMWMDDARRLGAAKSVAEKARKYSWDEIEKIWEGLLLK